ncbi:carboxylating nicotinate-nucleotide diphosphorylase [Brachybacterium sp.]|uniref:carboxylating nicotinate-nucleotide diphosphorylase n=1 Tax=Brachybacterium sp. TaxID=1891286 RepID=UPI002ED0F7DC
MLTTAPTLPTARIEAVVSAALAEDAPWGDLTGEVFLPADAAASAQLTAREPGVLAGIDVVAAAFRLTDPTVTVLPQVADGDRFEAGQVLAVVSGPARAVVQAERVALNLVQRMSGIATLTRRFVDAVEGTGASITDTRKTTPGLRALERHAVRCGGGVNHRFSLSDAVMAKDNHLAVLQQQGLDLTSAIRQARARLGHTTTLEVEVDRLEQIEPVLAGGVDVIMLDNFSLAHLVSGVQRVAGRATVEASGTVTLETVADIARTGVDVISSGALTHSARHLDLGLDMSVTA